MNKFFHGLYTALITPFNPGAVNSLDLQSFEKLVQQQIDAKIRGIIVNGSTGESVALSGEEYQDLIKIATSMCKGTATHVVAGVSAGNTHQAIKMANIAVKLGVNGIMTVTPYYLRPSQEGLLRHFTVIHDETDIPMMLYNVPSRTGVHIADDTIVQLAKLPRILSLKDASLDFGRPMRLEAQLKPEFTCLSGDDLTTLGYNAQGGKGCVSVISNVIPTVWNQVHQLCFAGEYKAAREIMLKFVPLMQSLVIDSNPVPIKYVISKLIKCSAEVRLPLYQLNGSSKSIIDEILKNLNLLHIIG